MNAKIQALDSMNGRFKGVIDGPVRSSNALSFEIENIQHLSAEEAIQCQSALGHGTTLGQWESPRSLFPSVRKAERNIKMSSRIRAYLPDALHSHPRLSELMEEAVLYLTRWAIVCRVGRVSYGSTSRGNSLDVSTIAQCLLQSMANIVARGVERRLTGNRQSKCGFAAMLAPEDLEACSHTASLRAELERLRRMVFIGLWSDEPAQVQFHSVTTQVKGARLESKPENKSVPYKPLPDKYVEQIGPRVIWLINDLGPNLLHLCHYIFSIQQEKRFSSLSSIGRHVVGYFKKNAWRDRDGRELKPPFNLRLTEAGKKSNSNKTAYVWPPRSYADLISLVLTLQRAHLFMTLLLLAARHGEVLTLPRDCIQLDEDHRARVHGHTYKSTETLEGKDRNWPTPSILVQIFAQQRELAQVMEQLEILLRETIPNRKMKFELRADKQSIHIQPHLWGSFGISGFADATGALESLASILPKLALAVDLDQKPGGINFHPHRLRKTMARLAGIAIDGSQKVLMQLLGHEEVATTLYYMQSDPSFRQEIEDVVRELRLIRMEDAVDSARAAIHTVDSLPNGGLGGGGASVLTQTIVKHENWLHGQGKEWGASDARELATLLADNGRTARLVAPGVVCTKSTHELGLCNGRMGEISPGNCKVECHSHIELAVGRRDVVRVIPILVKNTAANIENGEWLAAIHNRKQLVHEMSRFPDIGDEWRIKSEVQSLLAHDLEGEK